MFNPAWGGYPDADFLGALDPELAACGETLPDEAYNVGDAVGGLTAEWAGTARPARGHPGGRRRVRRPPRRGRLRHRARGAGQDHRHLDLRHGGGARWRRSCRTSPASAASCPSPILPGYYGLEAGQSAVGDIFNWFVNHMQPGGAEDGSHEALTAGAEKLRPGESGLLALDWNNGNRTVLVDQRLTGLLAGA